MALVQSQVLTLPKIKTNISSSAKNIPIVQHLIRDEDIVPTEVCLKNRINFSQQKKKKIKLYLKGEQLQPLPF